ncbi:hypothetical protein H6F78_09000 [Coleofasciculus sp. FACHB-64]|uniref:hypothetical protein n=1 Tax=Cyanophyceae TaxID=3028117 RepID=UPI0016878BC5|nr:hypothetical protein [Coleofasciculus sp. FACHB-64]MBD2045733.1 hypothetical protein [Coleofasciculus sp. FACHB-64]
MTQERYIRAIALFGFCYGGLTLNLAIAVGIIHTLEEIAMTLILPQWTDDVLSIVHTLSTAPILLKRKRCCESHRYLIAPCIIVSVLKTSSP